MSSPGGFSSPNYSAVLCLPKIRRRPDPRKAKDSANIYLRSRRLKREQKRKSGGGAEVGHLEKADGKIKSETVYGRGTTGKLLSVDRKFFRPIVREQLNVASRVVEKSVIVNKTSQMAKTNEYRKRTTSIQNVTNRQRKDDDDDKEDKKEICKDDEGITADKERKKEEEVAVAEKSEEVDYIYVIPTENVTIDVKFWMQKR